MIGTGLGASGAVRPFYNRAAAVSGITRRPVGFSTLTGGGTSLHLFPVDIFAGELLVIGTTWNFASLGASLNGISIDVNSPTLLISDPYNAADNVLQLYVYYVLATQLATDIDWDFAGNPADPADAVGIVTAFSGIQASPAEDGSSSDTGVGAAADSLLTPLTTHAPDLVYGLVGKAEGSVAPAGTWQGGLVAGWDVASAAAAGIRLRDAWMVDVLTHQERARITGTGASAWAADCQNWKGL